MSAKGKRARKRTALEQLERDFGFVRELGRGATAVVHLACEHASGEMVAVKIIRPQYLDDAEALGRFAREARYVAQLDHPNVVRMREVRDLGDAGVALVMAHASGPTLREHLQRHGALSVERAESILRDIASALAAAHDVGIAHRDVKPENIFLDEDGGGRALLADFGIARSMAGETQQLTMAGVAIGTPTYMAPEQIDGAALDGRGDLYSLGLTAWEMLVGHRPWEGEALYAVLYHQKHTQLDDVRIARPDVPDRLASAIAGAIEKDPDARWPSAHDLLAALDGARPLREWPSAGTRAMETVRVERGTHQSATEQTPRDPPPSAVDFTAPEWAETWMPIKDRRVAYRGGAVGLLALALVVTALHARSRDDHVASRVVQQSDGTIAQPASHPDTASPRSAVTATQSATGTAGPTAIDAPTSVQLGIDAAERNGSAVPIGLATAKRNGSEDARRANAAERNGSADARRASDSGPVSRSGGAAIPAPRSSAERIVPGGTHTCALAPDGIASCWGGNERGQLGSAGPARRAAPLPVSDQIHFAGLAAGMWHSCGVARDGNAWCWGMNDHGQLGDGSTAPRAGPVRVAGDRAFRQVATGASHSCALDSAGAAWCWGANDAGQLGDRTLEDAAAPVRVASPSRFVSIVAGWRFTCALDTAARAVCWGDGSAGQLGTGTRASRREPTAVSGGHAFASLAAGSAHACGVTTQGAAYCWGSNAAGQLGDGGTADQSTPARVRSDALFASIAAGAMHSCALTVVGTAYCWGRNSYGQLGDGGTDEHALPQPVAGGHTFTSLRAFGSHSCATTGSGEAFCWGFNLDGQLGDGSRSHRARPVYVERAGRG